MNMSSNISGFSLSTEKSRFSGESFQHEKIKKIAHDFEKMFVAEMLNIGKIGVPQDSFAQGHYGQTFGSFITNQYAEQLTGSNGGFGIAKMVEDSLMQSYKKGE